MKSITSFSTLLLCFFLWTQPAFGASLEAAKELYVKSGLEKQMQDIGPAILASYKNNYSKTDKHTSRDKKIMERIDSITQESFDAKNMKKTVLNGLSEEIDEKDMEQIMNWFDSPAGTKITHLEEMASSSAGVRESQEYIANIKNISISQERIRLIKELNSSMNLTETTVEIALATQFALSKTTKNEGKAADMEDILRSYKRFSRNRSRLEPILTHQVHGSLLYTYQELSNDELAQYVDFVHSDSGKKYNIVTSKYMLDAITQSSFQFAMKISQL